MYNACLAEQAPCSCVPCRPLALWVWQPMGQSQQRIGTSLSNRAPLLTTNTTDTAYLHFPAAHRNTAGDDPASFLGRFGNSSTELGCPLSKLRNIPFTAATAHIHSQALAKAGEAPTALGGAAAAGLAAASIALRKSMLHLECPAALILLLQVLQHGAQLRPQLANLSICC